MNYEQKSLGLYLTQLRTAIVWLYILIIGTLGLSQASPKSNVMVATLKKFLESCETLGTLRLIVTSSAAVLEVKTTIEKLFYAELPKGEYANMHQDTLEFHLNMDAIKQVKFEIGESKRGNFTTYAIRFLNEKEEPALSAFLQWGKPGEYAPGQVEAWNALREQYGEVWETVPAQ